MASQYAPESLPIVDPGNVPHFHIDGLAFYFEEMGIVHSGLFRDVPVLGRGPHFGIFEPRYRRLEFTFDCAVEVQRCMRRVITPIVRRQGERPLHPGNPS